LIISSGYKTFETTIEDIVTIDIYYNSLLYFKLFIIFCVKAILNNIIKDVTTV
jgi:hypothetical protein